jgi:hypothetical protein
MRVERAKKRGADVDKTEADGQLKIALNARWKLFAEDSSGWVSVRS